MASYHFLIIHGTGGSPEGNWIPWLKKALETKGHRVYAPVFPTPENQSFDSWRRVAARALEHADPARTILIGHSTGAIFVLRMAEMADRPFHAVVSVCPFIRDLGLDEFDSGNASFYGHAFDWRKVGKGAKNWILFAGDNDPYVPLSYSQDIADQLDVALHVVKNGGHLNKDSGFADFPDLLASVEETIKPLHLTSDI